MAASLRGERWHLVNLGRCWDRCDQQRVVGRTGVVELLRTPQTCCTHELLWSLAWARAFLAHSLPYFAPVDYQIAFLGRVGVLDVRSTLRPHFFQQRAGDAHDPEAKPTCDPRANALAFTNERRLAKELAATWLWRRAGPLRAAHDPSDYCRTFGPATHAQGDDPAADALLAALDAAGVHGVVVWGLLPPERHTHAFVHESVHATFARAFARSARARHLCWVPSRGVRLDTLPPSLVFASPKHAVWSVDPGMRRLAFHGKHRYVFHELPPRDDFPPTHRVLWVVRGDDGNRPALEAETFALRERYGCDTLHCAFVHPERVYVSPWGFRARSDDGGTRMAPNATRAAELATATDATATRVVNFVGTVWHLNALEFCDLVRGCQGEGVLVRRFGVNALPADLPCAPEDRPGRVSAAEQELLEARSLFVAAFQGAQHVHGGYVADRVLTAVSRGHPVLTNHPLVAHELGVTFAQPSAMCRAALDAPREALVVDSARVARLSYEAHFVRTPADAVRVARGGGGEGCPKKRGGDDDATLRA